MAIGSASQLAELNNRVRQLEQSHEDTKRQRVQYPCKFWGLDAATGRRFCSRELAMSFCPFAHLHDPNIMVPAAHKWLSAQELLASNPSYHGSSVPSQSPPGVTGLGQSLRPST